MYAIFTYVSIIETHKHTLVNINAYMLTLLEVVQPMRWLHYLCVGCTTSGGSLEVSPRNTECLIHSFFSSLELTILANALYRQQVYVRQDSHLPWKSNFSRVILKNVGEFSSFDLLM